MTEEAQEHVLEGALLQGSDGATYFIPNERLAAYRIPDELAGSANAAFEAAGDVAGFGASGGPQIMNALQGPLGRTNTPTDSWWTGHDENSNNAVVCVTGFRV